MTSHSLLRSTVWGWWGSGWGGGSWKLNDSLVISDKGRRPGWEGDTRLHHRNADLGLRLVGPFLHVQGTERAEGLEGPAPNTVISRTPYCIRTGQRRKAVPSHPYRGLVLGEVVLIGNEGHHTNESQAKSSLINHSSLLQMGSLLRHGPRPGPPAPGD